MGILSAMGWEISDSRCETDFGFIVLSLCKGQHCIKEKPAYHASAQYVGFALFSFLKPYPAFGVSHCFTVSTPYSTISAISSIE